MMTRRRVIGGLAGLLVCFWSFTAPAQFTYPVGFLGGGQEFPEVVSRDTSNETSDTTSHTVDMPATVDPGDLLIILFANDGAGTVSFGTFTEIFEKDDGVGNNVQLSVAYKQADGTEDGGTETVTTGDSEKSAHIVYRITGHVNPATQAPEISTGGTGNDDNPDPDSLTPTGGSKKYLWLVAYGQDGQSSIQTPPTNYGNEVDEDAGITASASVGAAERQLEAVSENPGTFDTVLSLPWVAATIAIHPQ